MRSIAAPGSAVLVLVAACSSFGSTPTDDDDSGPADASSDAAMESAAADSADAVFEATIDGSKLVFVSSGTFRGDLGGIDGADARCMTAAKNSSLEVLKQRAVTANFKALLAKTGMNPFARFPAKATYVLPSQTVITTDGFGAFQSDIKARINLDDKGSLRSDQNVWTGIGLDGGAGPNDCKSWTSIDAGDLGFHGDTQFSDRKWISSSSEGCNADNRLYCVEE